MSTNKKQHGLTLLEVLIALSLFAMIGVASYRVLSTVSTTQKIGEKHSIQLTSLQKAMTIIDADFQQLVKRDIRQSKTKNASYLQVNNNKYAIEMTRAGWSNPLMLSRSSLQRVAYDIGPHPQVNNQNSYHYQDQSTYLRRHYWRILDRTQQSQLITQMLISDVGQLKISVLTNAGRQTQWPLGTTDNKKVKLKGIEIRFEHSTLGNLTRVYRVH